MKARKFEIIIEEYLETSNMLDIIHKSIKTLFPNGHVRVEELKE